LVIAVVSLITDSTNWLLVVVAIVTAAVTPLAAGAAAYFQWVAKGIPEDYAVSAEKAKLRGYIENNPNVDPDF
jgi:hypothetical protein